MEKDFLMGLAVSDEVAEAILAQHGQELEALRAEHSQVIAQMEFDQGLAQAVAAQKGRNLTAIRALLDVEALRGKDSKAVNAAVAQLKKAHGYLFEAVQEGPKFSQGAGTQAQAPRVQETLAGALREKYGM